MEKMPRYKFSYNNLLDFYEKYNPRLNSMGVLVFLFAYSIVEVRVSFCLFKNIFGIPCPFCGLTSSLVSLVTLNWNSSFDYHPLGIVIILILLFFVISNKNPFENFILKTRNKKIHFLYSAKFLLLAFIMVWLFRL